MVFSLNCVSFLLTTSLYFSPFLPTSSVLSQGILLSELYTILAGVPQGSILAPILYSNYTAGIPVTQHTLLSSFAVDTVILSSSDFLLCTVYYIHLFF